MKKIKLKNIRMYAHHGCMEEEVLIGSFYLINLTAVLNIQKAGISDDLNDTVNYADLTQIIKEQMLIRSHLLEHVAHRIIDAVEIKYAKDIKKVKISVAKINPPVNADIDEVKVIFTKKFH